MIEFTIKLFIDGDQWCAMTGEDLMEGVAGFGDTQEDAMYDLALNLCHWGII